MRNNIVKKGFDTVNKHFCEDLIDSVTQTNRSKLSDFVCIIILRDESNVSLV